MKNEQTTDSLLAIEKLSKNLKSTFAAEAMLFPATINCVVNGVKTIADCIVRITKKGKLLLLNNSMDRDVPRQFSPATHQYYYWEDAGLLIENTEMTNDGFLKTFDILITPKN